jgi:hypothetical protein
MVACLAVLAAAIAVAGGSAGNRDGFVTFQAEPGPGAVTYGENIAYSSTFDNTTGNSTFTQIRYVQTRPKATLGGITYTAVLAKTSCAAGAWSIPNDADPTDDEFVCNVQGQLSPADPPAKVVTVWTIPATITSAEGCGSCLTSAAKWLIKERKSTNGTETFPNPGPAVVTAQLLAGQGSNETLRAGGYELGACTGSAKSLSTNQDVNEDNPVATSFCLPPFATSGVNIGIATTITETLDDPHTSNVCIAELGTTCDGTVIPKDFGPDFVTFEFHVAADALPSGYKITQVFHNSTTALPTCDPDVAPGNDGCVVSINLVNDQGTKTWVIIARSETNGPWNW